MNGDEVNGVLGIFKIWNILGRKKFFSLAAVLYTCMYALHTTSRPYVPHPIYATAHMPRNGRAFVQESLQM